MKKQICTAAFQRAIDALKPQGGKVTVPAGVYVTGELQLWAGVVVEGAGGFAFRGLPKGANTTAMFNLTGATLRDLALLGDVDDLPKDAPTPSQIVHGVGLFNASHGVDEGYPLVDHCLIRGFSGDGIHLHKGFCGNVRNCLILNNRGDGIRLDGWDFFIINNEINGNWGYGFHGVDPNNACTITANRIEWNHAYGLYILNGSMWNVTGNAFDRNWGAGLCVDRIFGPVSVTGNTFHRCGKDSSKLPEGEHSCQVRLDRAPGVSLVGNVFRVGKDDGNVGQRTPRYGFYLHKMSYSIISANVLTAGYMDEMVYDAGEHGKDLVIKDNVGHAYGQQ